LIPVFGIGTKQERRKKQGDQIKNTSMWMPGSGQQVKAEKLKT
jgi:hypothetical protein